MEVEPAEETAAPQGEDHEMAAADDDDADSSDSASDSSSSSDEEVEVDPADMEKLMKLESDLEANPNLYDAHIQYLELLRKCHLHVRLRAAHERMASTFPLSEQLWTEWVNDELSQVKGLEDIQRIMGLFDRATKDYLSVTLWCSYLEFMQEFDPEVQQRSAPGIKRFRDVCEAALTAAGLHVAEAGKLWALYRNFELQLESEGVGGDKQQERIRQLFHRQLQVPLSDGPSVLEACTTWEQKHGQSIPAHVTKSYAKAQEAVMLRRPYEEAVSPDKPADANLLAAYMAYIRLEQAQGDPARVQIVYERAVAAYPVTHELWMQYGRYLEVHLKAVPALATALYKRATRNCYWIGALWSRAIRAVARAASMGQAREGGAAPPGLDASLKEQAGLYQSALQAGLQDYECYMEVIFARLDGLRYATSMHPDVVPQLREAFQQAAQLLASYFPDHLDRSLRLPSYRAHCEALVCKDPAAARKVWEDTLVRGGLGKYYEGWAAWAAHERSLRQIKEARAVYKKAYNRKLEEGGQLAICADWVRFEREEGSPEDLLAASLKVEPIMEEAAAAAAAATDANAAAIAKAAAKQAPQLSKEEMVRMRRENDPNFGKKAAAIKGKAAAAGPLKGAAGGAGAAALVVPTAPAATGADAGTAGPKRAREQPSSEAAGDGQAAKRAKPADGAGGAAKDPHTTPAKGAAAEGTVADGLRGAAAAAADGGAAGGAGAEGASRGAGDGESGAAGSSPGSVAMYTDERTVFVKGLRMNLQDGELDELFKPVGDLVEVRLMRDSDGRFRGFAYVEFATDEGVQKAVALNGSPFQGKPLFVAKSRPAGPGKGQGRGEGGRGRGDLGGGRGRGGRWNNFEGGRGGGRGRGRWGDYEGGRGRGGGRGGEDFDGGRGGGRARRGLGFRGGRHNDDEEHGRGGGHHRQHIQLDDGAPAAAPATSTPLAFVPRAVAQAHTGDGAGKSDAPKSNDEFRKMLLAKK